MNLAGAAEPETVPWDFADYPYGLELLVLPPIGRVTAAFSETPLTTPDCDPEVALSRIQSLISGRQASINPSPAPSEEELFWFRWITGHQITFLIWRIMADVLERRARRGLDRDAVKLLRACTDGYNAMLLYTASCPQDIYHSLIRPRMYYQHHGFSGAWAPDFAAVRKFFRGNIPVDRSVPGGTDIAQMVKDNREVHDDVASRLVPNGRSLLQSASHGPPAGHSKRAALLYDSFFLTLRAAGVGVDEMSAQLVHRLQAVAFDIKENSLYPNGRIKTAGFESHSSTVVKCEDRFGQILTRTARVAMMSSSARFLSDSG